MNKKIPPFEITNEILEIVAEIAELIGNISIKQDLNVSPTLRRSNRIRTIYSSLAIEQNTLNLAQVTAILSGQRVIAPPKDIAEVKNAYEIYDMMEVLNPYSVDDLLKAHEVMTRGVLTESGCFRSGPVGVVDSHGNILHFGTLPDYVPQLVGELLDWVRDSNVHMLIKSCVFHYEFELIHPFADGNGRMGRLWHTLLLTKWKPMFSWIPIESIIHDRQDEYYKAINRSNYEGQSTSFIIFMLSAIKEALTEALVSVGISNNNSGDEFHWVRIKHFLKTNSYVTNADVRRLFGVSESTATRILSKLSEEDKLHRVRIGKTWGYLEQ